MYHIYSIRWSQTDHETVIVKAESRKEAQQLVDALYAGAFYRDHVGQTEKLHEDK